MEDFLTTPTRKWDLDTGAETYLKPIQITLVAIRDEDQAMVSLGRLSFDEPMGTEGNATQSYLWRSRAALFSSERFDLKPTAILDATHDANGNGTLVSLDLRLEHYSEEAMTHGDDGFVDILENAQYEYLLSYLAGIHHRVRESTLATIEDWHAETARMIGDTWPNYDGPNYQEY